MSRIASFETIGEATAYRYFPDLVSLLGEATRDAWPDPAVALGPVAHLPTRPSASTARPRRSCATSWPERGALDDRRHHDRPHLVADHRPGCRFALIDAALAPLSHADPPVDADTLDQLKRDLAVIVGAEALFMLTDPCGLSPEEAIASAARTAAAVTQATLGPVAAMPFWLTPQRRGLGVARRRWRASALRSVRSEGRRG